MKNSSFRFFVCMMMMLFLIGHALYPLSAQAETLHEPNPYLQTWADTTEVHGAEDVRGLVGLAIQPWFWVFSVIPGLGQMVMGELWHGFFYLCAPLLIYALILVIQGALGIMFATAAVADLATGRSNAIGISEQQAQVSGFFTVFGYAMIGLIYIWNGVDAFIMNQEKLAQALEQSRVYFEPRQGLIAYQVGRF